MGKVMRAIGLMSGTSLDGVDVALLDTDGREMVRRGASVSFPYPPEFRASLAEAIAAAASLNDRRVRPGRLADIEAELTRRHGEAALKFMGDRMLQPMAVDAIGFHGQTVLHRRVPSMVRGIDYKLGVAEETTLTTYETLTVQLGDGPGLAALTGIDVVYDLRANDCAHGGQGAPLAPIYHQALAARLPDRPVAFLNIGGVANVTWIGRDGELLAFDTGPGSAMIDDWMLRHRGVPCDRDGALAAQGHIHEGLLAQYMRHSYFGHPPPKSLDRNAFPRNLIDGLSPEDGAATLTAFTAAAIAAARAHFPEQPAFWVVCGGGRRNRTLMSMIAANVENAVVPAEAISVDGDSIEAEAWAYLAVRSLKGLPISFPGTTGVSEPMTGGVIARAR